MLYTELRILDVFSYQLESPRGYVQKTTMLYTPRIFNYSYVIRNSILIIFYFPQIILLKRRVVYFNWEYSELKFSVG